MIEPKSVKKRSVGRPKTNKALQKLRVQTWFNAVAESSGKTAYELEKEFAPSTVDREDFNKQRARLWEKYRLGKTMPTIREKKGGKKGIAQLVEERYPGTLKVLEDPIWRLANPHEHILMSDLKAIYSQLEHETKSLLLEPEDLNDKRFWRRPCENFKSLIRTLSSASSEDAYTAIICLLRECIICQQKSQYQIIISELTLISIMKTQTPTKRKLSKIALKEFG
jgi:hypothetical protein